MKPDTLVAVTERAYDVDGQAYKVIRCYWASGRTTFKDTGASLNALPDGWQLGETLPTPDALLALEHAEAFPTFQPTDEQMIEMHRTFACEVSDVS